MNTNLTSINKKANLRVQSLTVQRIFWLKKRLMARILWKPPLTTPKKLKFKYTISWWIRQCYGNPKDYSTHLQQAVTTQVFI